MDALAACHVHVADLAAVRLDDALDALAILHRLDAVAEGVVLGAPLDALLLVYEAHKVVERIVLAHPRAVRLRLDLRDVARGRIGGDDVAFRTFIRALLGALAVRRGNADDVPVGVVRVRLLLAAHAVVRTDGLAVHVVVDVQVGDRHGWSAAARGHQPNGRGPRGFDGNEMSVGVGVSLDHPVAEHLPVQTAVATHAVVVFLRHVHVRLVLRVDHLYETAKRIVDVFLADALGVHDLAVANRPVGVGVRNRMRPRHDLRNLPRRVVGDVRGRSRHAVLHDRRPRHASVRAALVGVAHRLVKGGEGAQLAGRAVSARPALAAATEALLRDRPVLVVAGGELYAGGRALVRHPAVLVIDQLAHTARPGDLRDLPVVVVRVLRRLAARGIDLDDVALGIVGDADALAARRDDRDGAGRAVGVHVTLRLAVCGGDGRHLSARSQDEGLGVAVRRDDRHGVVAVAHIFRGELASNGDAGDAPVLVPYIFDGCLAGVLPP